MKSIRTEPHNHGAEGDERIRTAEQAPGADPVYERLLHLVASSRDGDRFTIHGERIHSPIHTSKCHSCGMGTCSEAEYHPHLACVTFERTHDSREVWRVLRRDARAAVERRAAS